MHTQMNSVDSFIRGFNYGKARKKELTNREIAIQFPDVEPVSFASGNVDGIRGDRFRLELTLAERSRGLE